MAGNKPGPDPLFGKAMDSRERQQRFRDARAVELATLTARVADLETAAADPLAAVMGGKPAAIAAELVRRDRRKAVAIARRILALVA